jgi:hypothetical protein
MSFSPNFDEFYRIALIEMGKGDKQSFFIQRYYCKKCTVFHPTHWLITVEGRARASGVYGWKAYVYPSNKNGTFYGFEAPLYESPTPVSLEKAQEISRQYVDAAKRDQLILNQPSG